MIHPPWNFHYKIANVQLGKMVRFGAFLFLGYLSDVNVCDFIVDVGVSDSIEISG